MPIKDIIKEAYDILRYTKSGLDYLTDDIDNLTPFEQAKNLRELKVVIKHLSYELHTLAEGIDSLEPIKKGEEKNENI